MGLEMKDLNNNTDTVSTSRGNAKREIAAVYEYKDLNGNIIHSTVRYNPKDFRQRRPDPNNPGEYIWKGVFTGITPIMYNLTAVTTAIKEKQPVLLVEGEKDCDNLEKYGYIATTSPMGAGKWRDSFSTSLKGGVIYIIADNDEAGYKHFEIVAKSLAGKAEAVYLIDLPTSMPNIPTGGDISDFIEATPAEERQSAIAGLLDNATLHEADSKETPQGNGKKSQAEQLLELVEQTGATFFHSDIKDLYSAIPVREHMEVLPIMGRDFEIWLNGQFYNASGKPISKDAIKQTIGVLSAKALYDNPDPIKLSTRAADRDGIFWYDLTNTEGKL
jgi:5S rRNA maturation endonuclease (ribonuclease M5)